MDSTQQLFVAEYIDGGLAVKQNPCVRNRVRRRVQFCRPVVVGLEQHECTCFFVFVNKWVDDTHLVFGLFPLIPYSTFNV